MEEITIVKMEGRSLFTTTSNTFIWNSYTFTVLFIASCDQWHCFYFINCMDCISTIKKSH